MRNRISTAVALVCATSFLMLPHGAPAEELPPGYWPPERTPEILDLTTTVKLAPSLADLTSGERRALYQLIEAGKLIQRMYEDQRHPQALQAYDTLVQLSAKLGQPPETQSLLDLYRLFNGPIATTPDNRREAFLPVDPETPARNVYPPDATRSEIEAYLLDHPDDRSALMAPRTIVRRATPENLDADLKLLRGYRVIDGLHPGLRRHLEALRKQDDPTQLYALPQSVRWAPDMMRVFWRLNNAADSVESSDAEFARYLRNRARDLLSDDYESGDASWVTGNFKHLNAQIGSYETYDDVMFGVKAFMSLSILKRDEAATKKLQRSIGNLQTLEDSLPEPQHRHVRDDIPVGVYDVIADFGQARGKNTATALPNNPLFVKRYGKRVLLRANILRNPELFANVQQGWQALMTSPFDGDLTQEGEFNRTLWHEIGHYLGIDRDKRGRNLDDALQSDADIFEELKADLIALYAAQWLQQSGAISEQDMVNMYASGIDRTFLDAEPRRDQPYRTMELMQFNWLLDKGVFEKEPVTGDWVVHYDRCRQAVRDMLEAVLAIQYQGDRTAADAFIAQWTEWHDDPHEEIAKTIREHRAFRYALFRYAALGE